MSTPNAYWSGTGVKAGITFTNAATGLPADPTEVTLKVKTPAGVISTYTYTGGTVSRTAQGVYYKNVTVNAQGYWWLRYEWGDSPYSAVEWCVYCRESQF